MAHMLFADSFTDYALNALLFIYSAISHCVL